MHSGDKREKIYNKNKANYGYLLISASMRGKLLFWGGGEARMDVAACGHEIMQMLNNVCDFAYPPHHRCRNDYFAKLSYIILFARRLWHTKHTDLCLGGACPRLDLGISKGGI